MSDVTAEDRALAGTRQRLITRAKMIAAATAATDLPSPCVSICRMDEARGLCAGCLRTLDEIGNWRQTDDAGRRATWQRVAERAAGLLAVTRAADTTTTPTP